MCVLYILFHYYFTIIRIIFLIIFPIISQRTIISLYYFTIIPIIFTIISDYLRVSHPYFQELANANLRPMLQAMTDECPGVPAKLWDDQANRFMKRSRHIQLREDYYTHYVLYYSYCFDCLPMI